MTSLYIVLGVAAYILFGIAAVAFLSRKRIIIIGKHDDVELGVMALVWPVLILMALALLVFMPMQWAAGHIGKIVVRVGRMKGFE